MAFKSEAQRRWFFANQGRSSGGSSKGKSKRDSSTREYKPGTDPVKTLYKPDERKMQEAVKESNKEIAENKEDVKKIKKYDDLRKEQDSQQKFFNKKTNRYNQERNKVHEKIISKVDNPNAFPKEGEKPKVIFIGGLTASGKTSAIAKLIDRKKGVPDYKAYPKFVYLNSDDFKQLLPEYNGYNAGYLHEESTDIFDESLKRYRNQRKQIIIDATLKNTKSANKKIKEFEDAGYETVLYGTNLPGEKSIERATGRFKRTKRFVPPELIKKNAEPTNKSVLKLRHKTDKYAVFDTDVKKGEPVELIESDTSLKQDREQDAETIFKTEKEWREKGVDKSDLKGYDTKKHKKVKVRI